MRYWCLALGALVVCSTALVAPAAEAMPAMQRLSATEPITIALNPAALIKEDMTVEEVLNILGRPFYASQKQTLKYAYDDGYYTGFFAMWYDYRAHKIQGTISVHFINDKVRKVTYNAHK